jgi:hypothetical protein
VHFKRWEGLLLLFGLEFSCHYDERFTGSFYLSRSFHWGYMLRTFPREAFRRIGDFLTTNERGRLLAKEFQAPGVVDAWWINFSEKNCVSLIEAFDLTVERFLAQPDLLYKVQSCKELQDYMEMANATIRAAKTLTQLPSQCTNQPTKPKMNIGLNWYWAAELVLLTNKPALVSKDYVQLLAVDSWRLDHL